jgi:hypothetical protein
MNKYLQNNYLIILFTLIFLLLLYFSFYKFACYNFNLQTPGLLGDFIGGVVGTVLTAIAAVFVYRTYLTQKQQLEQQKKEANQNLVDNLYDRISNEIDALEITFDKNNGLGPEIDLVTYKGIFVLYNFKELYSKDNTVLNQLNLILISFEHLFKLTKAATYKWNIQKSINKDRNYLMFYTKIIWPFHRFYSQEWDKLIHVPKPHPDSFRTKSRFETLLKETYRYLLKRNLVGKPEAEGYDNLLTIDA